MKQSTPLLVIGTALLLITASKGEMLKKSTPLLIIGAALQRTGTTSIRMALEKLGYRVLHFTSQSERMNQIWNEFVLADYYNDTQGRKRLLDSFVEQLSAEGFNATLDQPSCYVYKELMEYYPDAKVLNTQRSSPTAWAKSMLEMSYSFDLLIQKPPFNQSLEEIGNPYFRWSKEKLGIRMEEVHKGGIVGSTDPLERASSVSMSTAIRAYKEYQAQVQSLVPKELLVDFSATQGWGPICHHFLPPDRDCPNEPFPHENTKSSGFLLDFKIEYSIRVKLYAIHPSLDQDWLVNIIKFLIAGYKNILWALVAVAVSMILLAKRRKFRA